MYQCPVCYFPKMVGPPREYNICPSCGTEFEYDDDEKTHAELREEWIAAGRPWFSLSGPRPDDWNPNVQPS